MNASSDCLKNMALGALGGFAGTLAIRALLTANQKWLPSTTPPIREDPGKFMLDKAEEALPERCGRVRCRFRCCG